jgi:hypothetical protein
MTKKNYKKNKKNKLGPVDYSGHTHKKIKHKHNKKNGHTKHEHKIDNANYDVNMIVGDNNIVDNIIDIKRGGKIEPGKIDKTIGKNINKFGKTIGKNINKFGKTIGKNINKFGKTFRKNIKKSNVDSSVKINDMTTGYGNNVFYNIEGNENNTGNEIIFFGAPMEVDKKSKVKDTDDDDNIMEQVENEVKDTDDNDTDAPDPITEILDLFFSEQKINDKNDPAPYIYQTNQFKEFVNENDADLFIKCLNEFQYYEDFEDYTKNEEYEEYEEYKEYEEYEGHEESKSHDKKVDSKKQSNYFGGDPNIEIDTTSTLIIREILRCDILHDFMDPKRSAITNKIEFSKNITTMIKKINSNTDTGTGTDTDTDTEKKTLLYEIQSEKNQSIDESVILNNLMEFMNTHRQLYAKMAIVPYAKIDGPEYVIGEEGGAFYAAFNKFNIEGVNDTETGVTFEPHKIWCIPFMDYNKNNTIVWKQHLGGNNKQKPSYICFKHEDDAKNIDITEYSADMGINKSLLLILLFKKTIIEMLKVKYISNDIHNENIFFEIIEMFNSTDNNEINEINEKLNTVHDLSYYSDPISTTKSIEIVDLNLFNRQAKTMELLINAYFGDYFSKGKITIDNCTLVSAKTQLKYTTNILNENGTEIQFTTPLFTKTTVPDISALIEEIQYNQNFDLTKTEPFLGTIIGFIIDKLYVTIVQKIGLNNVIILILATLKSWGDSGQIYSHYIHNRDEIDHTKVYVNGTLDRLYFAIMNIMPILLPPMREVPAIFSTGKEYKFNESYNKPIDSIYKTEFIVMTYPSYTGETIQIKLQKLYAKNDEILKEFPLLTRITSMTNYKILALPDEEAKPILNHEEMIFSIYVKLNRCKIYSKHFVIPEQPINTTLKIKTFTKKIISMVKNKINPTTKLIKDIQTIQTELDNYEWENINTTLYGTLREFEKIISIITTTLDYLENLDDLIPNIITVNTDVKINFISNLTNLKNKFKEEEENYKTLVDKLFLKLQSREDKVSFSRPFKLGNDIVEWEKEIMEIKINTQNDSVTTDAVEKALKTVEKAKQAEVEAKQAEVEAKKNIKPNSPLLIKAIAKLGKATKQVEKAVNTWKDKVTKAENAKSNPKIIIHLKEKIRRAKIPFYKFPTLMDLTRWKNTLNKSPLSSNTPPPPPSTTQPSTEAALSSSSSNTEAASSSSPSTEAASSSLPSTEAASSSSSSSSTTPPPPPPPSTTEAASSKKRTSSSLNPNQNQNPINKTKYGGKSKKQKGKRKKQKTKRKRENKSRNTTRPKKKRLKKHNTTLNKKMNDKKNLKT